MTFSDEPYWDVPVTEVIGGIALRQAMDSISQIKASGGTSMFKALNQAVFDIVENEISGSINILLLSDGRSADGNDFDFYYLSELAKNEGISISTIALGD